MHNHGCQQDKIVVLCCVCFRYAKYGYTGVMYCKACSESFRSHLTRTQTRALNGCSRADPCDHCSKVLAEFDCSRETVFHRFDTNRAPKAAKRQNPPISTAKGQGRKRKQQKALKQRHQFEESPRGVTKKRK